MDLRPNTLVRQSQSLAISAEVIQSIKLLQYSHEELQAFLQEKIERNPLINAPSGAPVAPATADEHTPPDIAAAAASTTGQDERSVDRPSAAGPHGRQRMTDGMARSGASSDGATKREADDYCESRVSLRDHLKTQLAMSVSSGPDYMVALAIVESLEVDGYLRCALTEIADRLGTELSHVERVLGDVQALEPAGVAARDLAECLRIQLAQRKELTPGRARLLAHLDLLAKYDIRALSRECGLPADDVLETARLIRHCDPRPGRHFSSEPTMLALPDLNVDFRADGTFSVELDNEMLPRVLVDRRYYAEVMSAASDPDDVRFITDCMREAKWLTRKLDQRARTILKVAVEIVRQQRDFFRYGAAYLKPLRIKQVADAVAMHESTVCRATANKFMMTSRGMFELKFFFVNSIAASDGGDDFSAESIRHKLKALIADETADTVLPDDAIVDALRRDGVKIARRTVAKYRDMLNIPSSTQRKRQKKAEELLTIA